MTQSMLTMEQQFALQSYGLQIQDLPRNELEDLFLELLRQKMAQENAFKDMMRGSFPGLSEGGCHGA